MFLASLLSLGKIFFFVLPLCCRIMLAAMFFFEIPEHTQFTFIIVYLQLNFMCFECVCVWVCIGLIFCTIFDVGILACMCCYLPCIASRMCHTIITIYWMCFWRVWISLRHANVYTYNTHTNTWIWIYMIFTCFKFKQRLERRTGGSNQKHRSFFSF